MKVMQELVAYFDRRGRLSPRQVRRLLDQGFLASDAPPNMLDLCDPIGATYYFRATGEANGPLWGTDVYTGDSSIAAAAVHAGVLKPGETGIVKITVVAPQRRNEPRFRPVRHRVSDRRDLTTRPLPAEPARSAHLLRRSSSSRKACGMSGG
jgi:hypothetical protein